MVREIPAVAEDYFTDHELEFRARVAEISQPGRRALEVASSRYLRRGAVSPISSLAVVNWLTSGFAKRMPDILF